MVGKEKRLHHGAPDIAYGDHAFLLAIHGFGEEPERLFDVGFFLACYVVLLCELGLAELLRARVGCCWRAAFWRLEQKNVSHQRDCF
jgi:hypothetical protein